MQGSETKYRIRGSILGLITIFVVWKTFSFILKNPALPSPELVAYVIVANSRTLLVHLISSLLRVAYSITLAFSLAFPIGILSRENKFDRFFMPFIYLLYPIPHIVLLPIYILIFGIGDLSKVALIATILFFQIVVTTRDASRQISDYYIYSILSLGASKFDVYKHVVIPASLPRILTAIRISIGTAIAVLFFAESFATNLGLGYVILDSWGRANFGLMYASMVLLALLGFSLYIFLEKIEKRICRWI
ncbi:ABC transporter permease [Archaeoglobales archaeon ex4484_92]|nr:MAG: ABC transporter permease [Archaeoglobales archaeon ex4484_92]